MTINEIRKAVREVIAEAKEKGSPKSSGKLVHLKKELKQLKAMKESLAQYTINEGAEPVVEFAHLQRFVNEMAKIKAAHSKLAEMLDNQISEVEGKVSAETQKIKEMMGLVQPQAEAKKKKSAKKKEEPKEKSKEKKDKDLVMPINENSQQTIPQNILDFAEKKLDVAKKKRVLDTVTTIISWLSEVGDKIVRGSVIGLDYTNIILVTNRGYEIYYDIDNQELEVNGKSVPFDKKGFLNAIQQK